MWLQKSQRFIFYSFTNDSFHRVNFAIICSHTMQYFVRKRATAFGVFFRRLYCSPNHICIDIMHEIRTKHPKISTHKRRTECTQSVNWNYCRMASTQIRRIVVYYLPFSFLTSVDVNYKIHTQIYQHHEISSGDGVSNRSSSSSSSIERSVSLVTGVYSVWLGMGAALVWVTFKHIFLTCIQTHSNEMIQRLFQFRSTASLSLLCAVWE